MYRRVAAFGADSARLAHTVRVLSRYGLTSRLRGHGPAWLRRHMTEPPQPGAEQQAGHELVAPRHLLNAKSPADRVVVLVQVAD